MWRRLTLDDRIILISGGALLLDSFAPWYWTDVGGPSVSRNAWHGPGLPFALLAVALGVGLAGLVVVRAQSGDGDGDAGDAALDPGRTALAHLLGGGLAFLAVILRMAAGRDQATWGLYLALVLSGGLLFGGLGLWKAAGRWWPTWPERRERRGSRQPSS
jgi:hypothetical protein